MNRLFERLKELELPEGEYAVFGSGPLLVRNIIHDSNDLDILCRGPAWQRVKSLGIPQFLPDYGVTIVTLKHGHLTFGDRWGIGDFDTDELIDAAEQIDGLPFVRLEQVVKYKQLRAAAKDLQHIEALRRKGYG